MKLLKEIKSCTLCRDHLPLGPKPIVQFNRQSKIILVSQAPGRLAHESGIPWNDPSGDRLRQWLNVERTDFYNPNNFAIVPMGFCFPGKGPSGDLPPRPECAPTWMEKVFGQLKNRKLILLIGLYAQKQFLNKKGKGTLTRNVRDWNEFTPEFFPLPHPSPRNNIWLRKNPWFEKEVVPQLQKQVHQVLKN